MVADGCSQSATKLLPLHAGWEFITKIGHPTLERLAGNAKHLFDLTSAWPIGPVLLKAHDYQNDAAPVNSAPHKKARGGQTSASAVLICTAETKANQVFIGNIIRTASRLALIVGMM